MFQKIDLHELAQSQRQYAKKAHDEHDARLKEMYVYLAKEFENARTYNEWAFTQNILALCRTGK